MPQRLDGVEIGRAYGLGNAEDDIQRRQHRPQWAEHEALDALDDGAE